jgi:predicted O-methyltransferase YrrM
MKQLKTIAWFLKQPEMIPQIPLILRRSFNRTNERSSEAARKWCETLAISQLEAFCAVLGDESATISVIKEDHAQEYAFALSSQEECPFTMGGEGATDLIYSIAKATDARSILETGVAYGWSSLAFLLAIKGRPSAKLVSNDMPYVKMGNEDWVGCAVPLEYRLHWDLQRLPDIKGIPLAIAKFPSGIDIIHYDSDKSHLGRTWSTPILWKALKPGGLFISDDINDNLAFKEFCDGLGLSPLVCEHKGKFLGIVRKP